MISLANGCGSCTQRDNLVQTVMETIGRPERPEYVLLEASGIAMTFNSPNLRDRIRLDSINCVVDAEQVYAHPRYLQLVQLKLRQIACADMMVLNKVDLAGPEQVQKVGDWIDEHFNNIRIVESNFCEVPYEILMGVGRFDPARTTMNDRAATDNHHDQDGTSTGTIVIGSLARGAIRPNNLFPWRRLRRWQGNSPAATSAARASFTLPTHQGAVPCCR